MASGSNRHLDRRAALTGFLASSVAVGAVGFAANVASAQGPDISADIAARLTPAQLQTYQHYLVARSAFERQLEMYWALIEERREHRRRKRSSGQPFTTVDFVAEQPPKYAGPALPPDIAKAVATAPQPSPEKPLPNVQDFLEGARTHYGFVPTRTTERDFKRRYAEEALRLGLSKEQVIRVYALETGGQGTIDMQSGIDPITKSGKPISSALGYAQLLHANSINELVKHGEQFARRCEELTALPGMPAYYIPLLQNKALVLRKMLVVAKSVPNEWKEHQKLAQTMPGLGIHALNLDADIGPWLQVEKLKALVTMAANDAGRPQLTGAELELMNLAGPRTGLDMMETVGRQMPTANFFSQGGYYRNTIVRDKTAAQLLASLDERMNAHINKPGSIEFAAVFDEVLAGQPAAAVQRPVRAVAAEQKTLHEQIFGAR